MTWMCLTTWERIDSRLSDLTIPVFCAVLMTYIFSWAYFISSSARLFYGSELFTLSFQSFSKLTEPKNIYPVE